MTRPVVLVVDDHPMNTRLVRLPRADGVTLTRQLRADDRFRSLPIVAVTAYAMASDQAAARDAGCSDFVVKPIGTRALGDLVVTLVERAA